MHHPTDRIAHTTAFVTTVVEHWLELEIAQWVHHMKDRSNDSSHHERMPLPRSYISLPAHTDTQIDVHTDGYINMYRQTCTYIHTHTRTNTCTHTHTRISTHTHIQTHMYKHTHVQTCTHVQTHTRAHTHAHIQTCTYTYKHTHTNTHTHTHTHTKCTG